MQHPITAGIVGFAFLAARVMYFTGYSTGVPSNRSTGGIAGYLSLFTLVGIIIKSVIVWALSLTS